MADDRIKSLESLMAQINSLEDSDEGDSGTDNALSVGEPVQNDFMNSNDHSKPASPEVSDDLSTLDKNRMETPGAELLPLSAEPFGSAGSQEPSPSKSLHSEKPCVAKTEDNNEGPRDISGTASELIDSKSSGEPGDDSALSRVDNGATPSIDATAVSATNSTLAENVKTTPDSISATEADKSGSGKNGGDDSIESIGEAKATIGVASTSPAVSAYPTEGKGDLDTAPEASNGDHKGDDEGALEQDFEADEEETSPSQVDEDESMDEADEMSEYDDQDKAADNTEQTNMRQEREAECAPLELSAERRDLGSETIEPHKVDSSKNILEAIKASSEDEEESSGLVDEDASMDDSDALDSSIAGLSRPSSVKEDPTTQCAAVEDSRSALVEEDTLQVSHVTVLDSTKPSLDEQAESPTSELPKTTAATQLSEQEEDPPHASETESSPGSGADRETSTSSRAAGPDSPTTVDLIETHRDTIESNSISELSPSANPGRSDGPYATESRKELGDTVTKSISLEDKIDSGESSKMIEDQHIDAGEIGNSKGEASPDVCDEQPDTSSGSRKQSSEPARVSEPDEVALNTSEDANAKDDSIVPEHSVAPYSSENDDTLAVNDQVVAVNDQVEAVSSPDETKGVEHGNARLREVKVRKALITPIKSTDHDDDSLASKIDSLEETENHAIVQEDNSLESAREANLSSADSDVVAKSSAAHDTGNKLTAPAASTGITDNAAKNKAKIPEEIPQASVPERADSSQALGSNIERKESHSTVSTLQHSNADKHPEGKRQSSSSTKRSTVNSSDAEHENNQIIEDPLSTPDRDAVFMFVSYASGVRGNISRINHATTILKSHAIRFTMIEITMNERAKRLWKLKGISKEMVLPAIFRDGDLKCDYDGLLVANELEDVVDTIFDGL